MSKFYKCDKCQTETTVHEGDIFACVYCSAPLTTPPSFLMRVLLPDIPSVPLPDIPAPEQSNEITATATGLTPQQRAEAKVKWYAEQFDAREEAFPNDTDFMWNYCSGAELTARFILYPQGVKLLIESPTDANFKVSLWINPNAVERWAYFMGKCIDPDGRHPTQG